MPRSHVQVTGSPAQGPPAQGKRRSLGAAWLLGVLLLGGVVLASLNLAEERAFVQMAERVAPWWLALAFAAQLGTYIAQGGIWRRLVARGGATIDRRPAFVLSLAKLFAEQALPSAGISSGVLVAQALEARGLPAPVVRAVVLVNIAAFHSASALALVVALLVLGAQGHLTGVMLGGTAIFLAVAVTIVGTVRRRAGHPVHVPRRVPKLLGRALTFVADADRSIVRDRRTFGYAVLLQLGIILLDATTLWSLLRGFGAPAHPASVFAAFQVASVVRTIGLVPGGLGTFDGSAVLMLHAVGVDVAAALSATLVFRGLSFFLPMVPGFFASRRLLTRTTSVKTPVAPFWAQPPEAVASALAVTSDGITADEAARRLRTHGPNRLARGQGTTRWTLVVRQLRNPLLLLLVFAAGAGMVAGEWVNALVALGIVLATVVISTTRESSAEDALAALRARLVARATVVRDGRSVVLPAEEIVPGDVVLLAAGALVPADARLLEATDLFVSEAVLTGESMPVRKRADIVVDADTPLGARENSVFLGTNVRSGTARALVVATGEDTACGAMADRLLQRPAITDFERGMRRFGYLLTGAMLAGAFAVFAVHVIQGRPPIDTLLFAVALALGLSPELLPAILGINLSRGAKVMAERGVLVRRLNAIENLGSMDVLCTDKTGTLTEGVMRLGGAYAPDGAPSDRVLELAVWNATLETGVASPLDDAIVHARASSVAVPEKVAEIPFDFVRRRVTVAVRDAGVVRLVTKGAFRDVLAVCSTLNGVPLDEAMRETLAARQAEWSGDGLRVLAVATRDLTDGSSVTRDEETGMEFAGFLTFVDRPKEGVRDAVGALSALGVTIKVITGDNPLVARHVAGLVGLPNADILAGRDIDQLTDEALCTAVERVTIFAEADPNQKERIIRALRRMGHVVGYLGDGVNDAPAMHAADTSLSVEGAVEVAREAADFVLLQHSLDVIRGGIEEGRRTFANTMKYVQTTTSANLGNMASMSLMSLVLPFLPMTAGQILLNNFLSDVPAVGLADDQVDPEDVARPRRWDVSFLGRYMAQFGLLSSVFDLLTLAALLWVFHATPAMYQTAWFVESLLTELVVALVVRTRRPFFRSRPGRLLLLTTMATIPLAFALPYFPFARVFGFTPLPLALAGTIIGITVLYVCATELLKRWFYGRTAPSVRVAA